MALEAGGGGRGKPLPKHTRAHVLAGAHHKRTGVEGAHDGAVDENVILGGPKDADRTSLHVGLAELEQDLQVHRVVPGALAS